jgi:hypothetical protein
LIKFFSGGHESLTANPQVAGGSLLQFDRGEWNGSPFVAGSTIETRHDRLSGLETRFIENHGEDPIIESISFPRHMNGSTPWRCTPLLLSWRSIGIGIGFICCGTIFIESDGHFKEPEFFRHKCFNASPSFHDKAEGWKLTGSIGYNTLFTKAFELFLETEGLESSKGGADSQIQLTACLYGMDHGLIDSTETTQCIPDFLWHDG